MRNFPYQKVLIATFSLWEKDKRTPINGMVEPMLSYFLPKKCDVDLIDGFHPGSSSVITKIEIYKKGKLQYSSISLVSILLYPFLALQNNNSTQILFKIRDFFSVFEWVFRNFKKYDIFIGLESVYTLAGIILKKLHFVNTVIYYVSDYSPNRYKQKWFNNLYLCLDRICVKNADYIWDVSPAIQKARIKKGLDPNNSKQIILVPNALFPKQIAPLPNSRIQLLSLVYAGTLTSGNGPDIAVEAVKHILNKYPKTALHIFGSNGNDQKRIKKLIQGLLLSKNVVFHGFIKDVIDITNAINKYQIGLAPYLEKEGSHRKYGDATKLRLYFGAGLPVITTSVPPLGKQAEQLGAALVTKDNPKDLAKGIIKLFKNKKLYNSMRKNAISFAKSNTWEKTYSNAFSQMQSYEG